MNAKQATTFDMQHEVEGTEKSSRRSRSHHRAEALLLLQARVSASVTKRSARNRGTRSNLLKIEANKTR
jgi:hypothetical protein